MNEPFYYNIVNLYNSSISPSTVHTRNNELSNYYRRYLLQRAMSVFKWTMPENWNERAKNYFLYVLYCMGFISIIETDRYGVIPQHCTLTGFDIFYQPTTAIINNPLISRTLKPKIGKQCVILRLQPDYGGILDIIGFYADQLSLLSEAVNINANNSKLSFAFGADNKTFAESMKKFYDNYVSGQPAVFYDKNLIDPQTGQLRMEFINKDVRNSYIITDLLNDIRTVMNHFDTDIGITNSNINKRERVLTGEIEANNNETKTLCSLWLESLQTGCNEAREMFGIDLNVDWRESVEMGVADNAVINNSAL